VNLGCSLYVEKDFTLQTYQEIANFN